MVIASEAKQSIHPRRKYGLLRRFSPVNAGCRPLSPKPAKSARPPVSVKHATLDLLRAFGIRKVFGNPGSTELPFLGDWPEDIDYVLGLQEASVIGMADGYAQATRNAAFVNLHSAAGVGNALGNIFTAHRNQTPMVITAGQQARSILPLQPFLYAERVADAGGGMKIDEGGVAGGLGVAVGHADHRGFLQAQHIVDVVRPVGEKRQFGRTGIAEHLLDPERAQQVARCLLDPDRCRGAFCWLSVQCRVPFTTSFRDGAEHQTRNLVIPGLVLRTI